MGTPNTLNHKKFDQFLNHELNEGEEKEFLAQLDNQAQLMDEFQVYVLSKKAIQLSAEEEAKKMIDESVESELKRVNYPKMILQVAAAIVLLFGAWEFLIKPVQEPIIAETLFENMPPPKQLSGGQDIAALYLAYEKKNYIQAIVDFDKIPEGNNEFSRAKLFQGFSFTQVSPPQYGKAIESLELVIGSDSEEGLKDYAEWNKLICLIALEKTDDPKFEQLLKKITTNSDHKFQAKAKALPF